jgi:dihydrofolate reductase
MGSQVGMIVACDLNGLIGYDGRIPWENKEDMRRFKELTMDSTVIVGCKTYESLPGKKLPGRIKHVLDDMVLNKHTETADTMWFYSLKDALLSADENNKIWIIGGAQLYKESLDLLVPDFIDLTIMNFVWFSPLADRIDDSKNKKRVLPAIPHFYMVESECQNQNDKTLFHRKYIRRPGGFGTSFIEDIRKAEKEKNNGK